MQTRARKKSGDTDVKTVARHFLLRDLFERGAASPSEEVFPSIRRLQDGPAPPRRAAAPCKRSSDDKSSFADADAALVVRRRVEDFAGDVAGATALVSGEAALGTAPERKDAALCGAKVVVLGALLRAAPLRR